MPVVTNWLKSATNYIFRLQEVTEGRKEDAQLTKGCTEDAQLGSKQGIPEINNCKQAVGGNLCMF